MKSRKWIAMLLACLLVVLMIIPVFAITGTQMRNEMRAFPQLGQTATNPHVYGIQNFLRVWNRVGDNPLNQSFCDGIFGSNTKAVLQSFQREVGLGADGICGPNTWGKMYDHMVCDYLYLGCSYNLGYYTFYNVTDIPDDSMEIMRRGNFGNVWYSYNQNYDVVRMTPGS